MQLILKLSLRESYCYKACNGWVLYSIYRFTDTHIFLEQCCQLIALYMSSKEFGDHKNLSMPQSSRVKGLKDMETWLRKRTHLIGRKGLVITDWSVACCYHGSRKKLGQKMADTMLCCGRHGNTKLQTAPPPLSNHTQYCCLLTQQPLFTLVTLLAQSKFLDLYMKRIHFCKKKRNLQKWISFRDQNFRKVTMQSN